MRIRVNDLINVLRERVTADPEWGEYFVAVSKDPEGNGFSMLTDEGLYSAEKIGEVYGGGSLLDAEFVGKPVLVIWPGYPHIELADPDEDDE